MPDLDEELQAYGEELERQKEEERRKQRSGKVKDAVKQEVQSRALDWVKKRFLQQGIKAGVRGAVGTAGTGTAAAGGTAAAAGTAPVWGTVLVIIAIIVLIILLVIGFLVVLYQLCNAGGKIGAAANVYSKVISTNDFCKILNNVAGGPGGSTATGGQYCQNPQQLASQNNEPYPAKTDPQLASLIACISSKPAVAGRTGSIATFEQSNASCNYTRGQPVCGDCAHTVNSCHYGSSSGITGALAVDFGEEANGANILQAAATCSAELNIPLNRATCESGGDGSDVACSAASADHVHISIAACTTDHGPINSQ
ncbi:hypothetical protein D4R52_03770 [bacterium]|nr:MAG: hypothetical protein D4R52_03770 [bacterium]